MSHHGQRSLIDLEGFIEGAHPFEIVLDDVFDVPEFDRVVLTATHKHVARLRSNVDAANCLSMTLENCYRLEFLELWCLRVVSPQDNLAVFCP